MYFIAYIRILLSLALLYGAYAETGLFTTLILFLILGHEEINAYLHRKDAANKQLKNRPPRAAA